MASWKPSDGFKMMGRSARPLNSRCPRVKGNQKFGKDSYIPPSKLIQFDSEGRQIVKGK